MIFLGLDASSAVTGWAIMEATDKRNIKLIGSGEIKLSTFKKKAFPLEYVLMLHLALSTVIKRYKPEICYIEDIYYRRNQITFKSLARIRGICELACLINNIKLVVALSVSEVRNKVLGSGKLEKHEVCAIMEQRFNVSLASDGFDKSDAVLMALAGVKEFYV